MTRLLLRFKCVQREGEPRAHCRGQVPETGEDEGAPGGRHLAQPLPGKGVHL
jgi:hypothetical protein